MVYRVEGFTFETEEEARLASKEAEGIKYIRTRNNMNDPNTVFKLYNRLIEKEVFSTQVGFAFLGELRRYLIRIPHVSKKELLPLPKAAAGEEPEAQEQGKEQERGGAREVSVVQVRHSSVVRDYYRPFLVSTFLAIVFAMALMGIFIIMALSSDNVTILNYENQLIDRYEQWEQDLSRRERELKVREHALEQREDTQWTN